MADKIFTYFIVFIITLLMIFVALPAIIVGIMGTLLVGILLMLFDDGWLILAIILAVLYFC